MLKAVLFMIYILLILTVIFLERKSPTEAMLWVIIMICVPYLGALLYLIFGSTMAIKITAFVRKKRLRSRNVSRPALSGRAEEAVLSEEDRQVIRFNTTYNGSPVTCYDSAELFTDGASHYRRLFQDIRNAKECICVEFYTIQHDLMGEKFAEILAEKASEGVRVMVMCDFIANIMVPQKMFRPIIEAGGQVIRLKPYLTHYRSHRKIVAIDHKIGYIGGMNIGKQYANMGKHKNPWRDTQVRLTGECLTVLEQYFFSDWLCGIPRNRWEETCSYIESLKTPAYEKSSKLCQFIIGGVENSKESAKMCYLSMIRSAKKNIRIQSPYFIPDASILDALKTAAASGVQIELMIPGIKASFFLDPVTNYYTGQLLEYGAKAYRYHGYIHAKTMVIDDELCCIGSVNIDMRSLMVDDEVCGVFYENSLVNEYIDIYRRDIESCTPFTWEEFKTRGRKEKLAEGIFLPFAPLM